MKKIIALIIATSLSTSAYAFGPREQGILTGIAGYWIFDRLSEQRQMQQYQGQAPVVVQTHPTITIPQRQQFCESTQVIDQFGQARLITYCYNK
jgi:hypothetical protein